MLFNFIFAVQKVSLIIYTTACNNVKSPDITTTKEFSEANDVVGGLLIMIKCMQLFFFF